MTSRTGCLLTLALASTVGVSLALDSDRDGISDQDEANLHLTNPYLADTDFDGADDLSELHAGTDPLDPTSRFAIRTIVTTMLPSGEPAVELSFESAADRRYAVYYTADLAAPDWQPVMVDVQGTGETITLVDEAPGEGRGFYRLSTHAGSSGLLTREVWNGIAGSDVADLTGAAAYPDSPDLVETLTSFDVPADFGDDYGQRISGYIIPPVSGDYTFRIASDDASELWLSTSADPAERVLIAGIDGWTGQQEWDKFPGQESAPVSLEAGQSYYIEVLHKEAKGGDHLSVAWATAGMSQRVIDGAYSMHMLPVPPSVSGDSYTVMEDETATIAPYGVLRNDVDPDGNRLFAQLRTGVRHGTLVLNADGGFSYTPDPDFHGTDSFTYAANDGTYTSAEEALVNLTVIDTPDATITARGDYYAPAPADDLPPAGDDCVVSAPGVLINDIDPDGLGIEASLDTDVQNGTLTLNLDGSFIYNADPGFEGIDTFTYVATRGGITSAPATVTLDMGVLESALADALVLTAIDCQFDPAPPNGGLKYENRNGYENLGVWNNVNDTVYWTVDNVPAGVYQVQILVSAAGGQGGSFEFQVDGALPAGQIAQTVTATGGWDTYEYQLAAVNLVLSEGAHTFKIQPVALNATYLCNFINCTLTPVKQFEMPAAEAVLPATGIRLEDGYDPPNLGYWSSLDAIPRWNVVGIPADTYDFYVLVSGPVGSGGTYQVLVDGAPLPNPPYPPATLAATGSWHDDYEFQLAAANLALGGDHEFGIDPITKNSSSFTNLRACVLVPAGGDPFTGSTQETIDNCNFITGSHPLEGDATCEAWINAMIRARAEGISNTDTLGEKMWATFPLFADWFLQDNQVHDGFGGRSGFDARGDFEWYRDPNRDNSLERGLIASVCAELGRSPDPALDYPAGDPRWLWHYAGLCKQRRLVRLEPLRQRADKLVYAVHMNMGTIYLATETQGCGPGSELREIDLTPLASGGSLVDTRLFDAAGGIVRDPEISFDGQRMLFAWRQERNGYATTGRLADPDGHYKIYEMNLADRSYRQLTFDENDPVNQGTYGADFEPCYLPNDDIMFSSARIVQEVTCGWGDCSNLFIMDRDGNYARRIGFDQTQTAFPHLLDDGRVVFTRRDYNDRGQTHGHALFVMNPDGAQQTEYYGNNTFEPTSMQHTRPIPGTGTTLSIAGGYHTTQGGKLVRIDPRRGRQDYTGLEFHNWDHTLKTRGGDKYGREGEQFTYPYPMTGDEFLVSYSPLGGYLFANNGHVNEGAEEGRMRYKLYHMSWDGKREMLAAHPTLSCVQAVPVMARAKPAQRMSLLNYTKDDAYMYVQNVYYGTAAEGIAPGSIDRIRVVEMYYKPISIGASRWSLPGSVVGPGLPYAGLGTHSVTPTGVGTASFDAKGILGEAQVHADGSAMFVVPARKPIYLQLINTDGVAVQTMRSWATLMPNEFFACAGCHEENDSTPVNGPMTIAMQQPPLPLQPFANRPQDESFSFARLVQPILDTHCASCHSSTGSRPEYDLSNTEVDDRIDSGGSNSTRRTYYQSYLTLLDVEPDRGDGTLGPGSPNQWVDYFTRLRTVEITPPYAFGSAQSGMIDLLRAGHHDVGLSDDEMEILCAWIDLNVPLVGDYDEMNTWDTNWQQNWADKVQKRIDMEAIDQANIEAYIQAGQPQ